MHIQVTSILETVPVLPVEVNIQVASTPEMELLFVSEADIQVTSILEMGVSSRSQRLRTVK